MAAALRGLRPILRPEGRLVLACGDQLAPARPGLASGGLRSRLASRRPGHPRRRSSRAPSAPAGVSSWRWTSRLLRPTRRPIWPDGCNERSGGCPPPIGDARRASASSLGPDGLCGALGRAGPAGGVGTARRGSPPPRVPFCWNRCDWRSPRSCRRQGWLYAPDDPANPAWEACGPRSRPQRSRRCPTGWRRSRRSAWKPAPRRLTRWLLRPTRPSPAGRRPTRRCWRPAWIPTASRSGELLRLREEDQPDQRRDGPGRHRAGLLVIWAQRLGFEVWLAPDAGGWRELPRPRTTVGLADGHRPTSSGTGRASRPSPLPWWRQASLHPWLHAPSDALAGLPALCGAAGRPGRAAGLQAAPLPTLAHATGLDRLGVRQVSATCASWPAGQPQPGQLPGADRAGPHRHVARPAAGPVRHRIKGDTDAT